MTRPLDRLFPRGSVRRRAASGVLRPVRKLIGPKPRVIPARLRARFTDLTEPTAVESALRAHYFADCPPGYLDQDHGKDDMVAHLSRRLHYARHDVVPWLDGHRPLAGAKLLEIGCGTGSDLVAFAEQGAEVTGLDVHGPSLRAAEERLKAYGLTAKLVEANVADVPKLFAGERFDWIVFYASLEHMTLAERLGAMRETWAMLPDGGHWCVADTPNRLWFEDNHTAFLPFFHWLPDELAFEYARFSRRENFRDQYMERTPERMLSFLRQGRGISFHEFSVAIGPAESLNVVSCLESFLNPAQATKPRPARLTGRAGYASFLAEQCPGMHAGFFQEYLNLVIRK